MSVTTRKGYRKSLVAKRYANQISRTTGARLSLRQARKEWEVIEELIKTLAPLKPRQREKILKAVNILAAP